MMFHSYLVQESRSGASWKTNLADDGYIEYLTENLGNEYIGQETCNISIFTESAKVNSVNFNGSLYEIRF